MNQKRRQELQARFDAAVVRVKELERAAASATSQEAQHRSTIDNLRGEIFDLKLKLRESERHADQQRQALAALNEQMALAAAASAKSMEAAGREYDLDLAAERDLRIQDGVRLQRQIDELTARDSDAVKLRERLRKRQGEVDAANDEIRRLRALLAQQERKGSVFSIGGR